MPNLTETFLRMRSPVGEMLGQYHTAQQMASQKANQKANRELAKLDFDLRSQMEQRRLATAEKQAEQEHAKNIIDAGEEYKKFVYDAGYQGLADPNVLLSGWAGVAKRRGIALTEPPPLTHEEIMLITKQAQGDKVIADKKAEKDALKKAPEGRTIQRGTQKVYQEFDPVTGGWTDVAEGPQWKAGGEGGGGGVSARTGRPDFNKFTAAQKQDYLGLYQQFYTRAKNHPELYGQLPPPTLSGVMQFYNSDSDKAGFLDIAPAYMSAQHKIEQATLRAKNAPPAFAIDDKGAFNKNLFIRGFLEGKGDEGLSREESYALEQFNDFRRSLPQPSAPGGGATTSAPKRISQSPQALEEYLTRAQGDITLATQLAEKDGWIVNE